MAETAVQAKPQTLAARVHDQVVASGHFEDMLPEAYRPMAGRMLKRAQLYISMAEQRNPKLKEATLASLVKCVLEAGSYGLCLDGKMAHAVPFNNKKKDENGREYWAVEATFMPDYKGIVDMARRHGAIKDADADHHYSNDDFDYWREDAQWHVRYRPALGNRGEYLGTFAVVVLPSGQCKPCYMTKDEIEKIRQKSKAKDSGPWVDHWHEMAKKTVIKRALKLYATDPDTADLIDHDNAVVGYDDEHLANGGTAKPRTLETVAAGRRRLAAPDASTGFVPDDEPADDSYAQDQGGSRDGESEADLAAARAFAAEQEQLSRDFELESGKRKK